MSEIKLILNKSGVKGEVTVPSSKSFTHRAIIAASLAEGISKIYKPLICEDTLATLRACKILGAKIEFNQGFLEIKGIGARKRKISSCFINCRDSGSTIRFITPLAGIFCRSANITGSQSLLQRPMEPLVKALRQLNFNIDFKNSGIFIKSSSPKSATVRIPGNISSQYISGLLFALPLLSKESTILVTTEVESKNYILMTLDVLKEFGIEIKPSFNLRRFIIRGGQQYRARNYKIEGDYSASAFLFAAGVLAGKDKVIIKGLNPSSLQGDAQIVMLLKRMGGDIEFSEGNFRVKKSKLRAINIDAKDIPDLVPVLAVVASQAKGETIIRNVQRLKIKESNRLEGIVSQLKKMGAFIKEDKNILKIKGPTQLTGALIDSYNDHRITMAFTIAGLIARGSTVISNPTCVKKSYPEFFDDIRKLGVNLIPITSPFGKRIQLSVYGDSHGKKIGAEIKGIPKGVKITKREIQSEMEKRRSISDLSTDRKEPDKIRVIKGIKRGVTTGEPIKIEILNKNVHSRSYELIKTTPRPGHADFTARTKYASVFDYRGGGFASGRMTAAMVAAGAIAKKFLKERGIKIRAYVRQIGDIRLNKELNFQEIEKNTYSNPVRCPDSKIAKRMEKRIKNVKKKGDSIGGIVECRIIGLPVGIGEPLFYSVESVISQAMFSIPGIKGVEFGSGFRAVEMLGSEHNDPFSFDKNKNIITKSNNSGGILGGITNSMPVYFRIAVKPTSSIGIEQETIDLQTFQETKIKVRGRHDPCIAIRVPPIVEAMTAISIADLYLREEEINF